MTIFSDGVQWWATYGIIASLVVVSLVGARVQSRYPRAPALALAVLAAIFVVLVALALWSSPGARVEGAPAAMVAWGLPSVASLTALAVFRRVRPWARVAIALLTGGVGCLLAVSAAFAVACALFGSCL